MLLDFGLLPLMSSLKLFMIMILDSVGRNQTGVPNSWRWSSANCPSGGYTAVFLIFCITSYSHAYIGFHAFRWGFDICSWQRHLNPLTWPEILRQFTLAVGYGPKSKRRNVDQGHRHEENKGADGRDIISNLRSGATAESALAIMQERGFSNRRSRHRLTPGTVKYAAFHVLSLEGSHGLSILDVADNIQGMMKTDYHERLISESELLSYKMTTAISIEDVRREVKLLKSLSGHQHMVQFYDAFEDDQNVYIVMELCEGGGLLDRILSRGGRYSEKDAKSIVMQILSVAAFTHLQGVVHRDLKPENFLFSTKDEDSPVKVIDFGLSDFVRPDQRLNDIVGSAYYVAPEVLHRSYNVEADMWSIGVIIYILLCGSRPFFARTESGIFRSVVKAEPNLNESPWPSVSSEAKDFVKRLLNKDNRKRMTASQALTHPWLRDEKHQVPLDILIYKLVKSYVRATPLRRAALMALSKALTEDELIYLSAQFNLLEPKDGCVSLDNFKMALVKHSTIAMKESRVFDILDKMKPLSYTQMTFEEFSAAAISPHQLEALERWETIANKAFQYFELEGNRVISVDALAQEMNVGESAHSTLNHWIRSSDGKLNFLGYTKFLHGLSTRSYNTRHVDS